MARLAVSSGPAATGRDAAGGALSDFQRAVVLRPTDGIALDVFARLRTRMAFADWLRRTAG
jgi:hypothetical protein